MMRGEMIVWQFALVLHETIDMVIQDLLAKEISVLATGMCSNQSMDVSPLQLLVTSAIAIQSIPSK